jgi:hypothetical protein
MTCRSFSRHDQNGNANREVMDNSTAYCPEIFARSTRPIFRTYSFALRLYSSTCCISES